MTTEGPLPSEAAGQQQGQQQTDPRAALEHVRRAIGRLDDPAALLAGFFAYSPVAFQVYRADGVSLLTNPAFRELFGSEPPPEYNVLRDEIAEREGVLPLIRRAFGGEVVRTPPVWYDPRELRQVHVEQGNRVAIEATFFPLFGAEGRVSHVAIAFRDVTRELTARESAEAERDRAEAMASERQAVLAQLAEGVILTDPHGRVTFVNEAARRLHGVSELGVGVEEYSAAYHLFTLEGEPYPPEELPLARAVLGGETVVDARWRVRRPDGTEILAEGSAAPVVAADGTRLGSALVVRDITAQLALEKEKDEFLESAAHDLKTPITAILGSAQVLARRVREQRGNLEAQLTTIATIEGAARQMNALLDEVLDLSRLRMERPLELEPEPTDLVHLVKNAVTAEQQATELHRLRVEAEEAELVGEWDARRLRRVLDNLLDNAIKYSPDGGAVSVRVGLTTDAAHRRWAVVSVSDEGLGIPANDLPHVFERFRRGSNVAGRIRGTGIGLAAARQVIEQHGGSIEFDSREGYGSTFSVRLPL